MVFTNSTFTRPLLITVLGLGLGCAGIGINQGDFSLISIQEEWELGSSSRPTSPKR